MKFSVIIPVRNRSAEIARCVAAVRECDWPEEDREILVVDNGSTDATARQAEEAGARVLSEPQPNRCRARNRGAAAAQGEWLAFIDSDCKADPQWLGALAAKTRELDQAGGHAGAVAGAVRDAPPKTAVMAYLRERRWFDQEKYLARSGREPFTPRFALTANLAVRRDVFQQLGGLDINLVHAVEDADFCLRLADAGWGLDYCAAAIVTHHHRATAWGLWRQANDWGAGQAELFAKWQARWGWRVWIEPQRWIWAAKGLAKTPWRLATGRTPLERWEPWFDFLTNAGLTWGRLSMGLRKGKVVM